MEIRLDGGEKAEARSYDGNLLVFWSPLAFAPGSPIRFAVMTDTGARPFEGRAVGSKRLEDARFEVRMRFVNLRRDDRAIWSALPAP
ncbi:MAG: hypothetical protein WBM46_16225 [Polyangiales bacterium]|jgi:hypothetical protein